MMKEYINFKIKKPIHFLKKIIIHFVNMETDPKIRYHRFVAPRMMFNPCSQFMTLRFGVKYPPNTSYLFVLNSSHLEVGRIELPQNGFLSLSWASWLCCS